MKKLTELTDLRGKKVFVRASLNVPVKDGAVTNAYRLERALPTLRYLHEAGAKVVIAGHIGRDPNETLHPVLPELQKFLPVEWGGKIGEGRFEEHLAVMSEGHFLLVENLRQDEREKANDEAWAARLAEYFDVYVNDAFPNCHREHMSMVGLPRHLPAYAGLNLIAEVEQLTRVMQPEHPALFLLGGAKFDTKMPLVSKHLDTYDNLFVAGALMNDIFKAKGYEVGKSLVSDVDLSGEAFISNEKLLLPVDVVVDGPKGRRTVAVTEVSPEESIMDVGPETVAELSTHIEAAKTVLWNGPFGAFEMGFGEGTVETLKKLAASDALSVVGGGDTVAALEQEGLNNQLSFVSTGGGAMLTLLEKGTLPALELLQ